MAAGTALTVAGLATTATTAGLSFAQASKQRKLQSSAEAAAAASMVEARKKLDVNFYKGLGINKEPYQLERDALLSVGAQALQYGAESERGAASVAGRVQMAQNSGQREIASAMGQDTMNLNKLVATEDTRLKDIGMGLDLDTVAGAQLAARNNQMLANNSIEQGFEGVTSLLGQGAALAPLYSKTNTTTPPADPTAQAAQEAYNTAASTGSLHNDFMTNGQPMAYEDAFKRFAGNSGMSHDAFLDYLKSQQQDIGLKNYKMPYYDESYGFDAVQ